MKTWIFEVRDSDGNNSTVFDAIVSAETRELASDKLWAYLKEAYPNDESDGGYGTYHACDCACPHRKKTICSRCSDSWDCSHGGLFTNEDCDGPYGPQEYPTAVEARDAYKRLTYYHSLIDLTEDN